MSSGGSSRLTTTDEGGEIAFGVLDASLEVEYGHDSIGFRWGGRRRHFAAGTGAYWLNPFPTSCTVCTMASPVALAPSLKPWPMSLKPLPIWPWPRLLPAALKSPCARAPWTLQAARAKGRANRLRRGGLI